MSRLVPTKRTTPSKAEFARAALLASPALTKEGLGILYAHFAGETSKGVHCYNWNLGNVKHYKGSPRDYIALKGVWEIVNGKRVELAQSDPGSWFQAFTSLDDGMSSFIQRKQTGRYAGAWPYVLAGDPEGYARALREKGYYTAPLADYMRSMRVHFNAWMAGSDYEAAPPEKEPDVEVRFPDFQIVHASPEFPTSTPDFKVGDE